MDSVQSQIKYQFIRIYVKYIPCIRSILIILSPLFLCFNSMAQADLSISTVVDYKPVQGQIVVFTLTITNNGPSQANNVIVNDLLPDGYNYISDDAGGIYTPGSPGTWTTSIVSLIVTGSVVINITCSVNAVGTSYNNLASVSADEADLVPANNSSSSSVVPVPSSNMNFRVTKGNSVSFNLNSFDLILNGLTLADWTVFQVLFFDDYDFTRTWGMSLQTESQAIGLFTGSPMPLNNIEIRIVSTTGIPEAPFNDGDYHSLASGPFNIISTGENFWGDHTQKRSLTISYKILSTAGYPSDVYVLNLKFQMF